MLFVYIHTYIHVSAPPWQKASKRPPKGPLVAPGQKVASFISNSQIGNPLFLKGAQFPKKGIPGRLKLKIGQFYQQLKYWEAFFLKGPKSHKMASERPLHTEMAREAQPERPREAERG